MEIVAVFSGQTRRVKVEKLLSRYIGSKTLKQRSTKAMDLGLCNRPGSVDAWGTTRGDGIKLVSTDFFERFLNALRRLEREAGIIGQGDGEGASDGLGRCRGRSRGGFLEGGLLGGKKGSDWRGSSGWLGGGSARGVPERFLGKGVTSFHGW
jgi:hypothetical protein